MRQRPTGLGPWVWSQQWLNLLFLHWRVPASSIEPHLPPGVEVETYQGTAWLSFVLFRLKVRPRWLPFLPGVSALTEVNLRTYVRAGERSGIFFLSIHADNRWAIGLARALTPLPYQWAPMSYRQVGEGYRFHRSRADRSEDELELEFRPVGASRVCSPDSLDAWLLERYEAFAWSEHDGLKFAEVDHPRWTVQQVEVQRVAGNGPCWWPFAPPRPPDVMHYAEGVAARFGGFRQAPAFPWSAPDGILFD